MLVDYEYFKSQYKGINISEAEFLILSPRCERVIDNFVSENIPYWGFETYNEKKVEIEDIKLAICSQIEVVHQSNGMWALTGGADSGDLTKLDGVPIDGVAKDKILRVLRRLGLMYRGI